MKIETSIEITRIKIMEAEIGPIKIHDLIKRKLTEAKNLGITIMVTIIYMQIIADILLLNTT